MRRRSTDKRRLRLPDEYRRGLREAGKRAKDPAHRRVPLGTHTGGTPINQTQAFHERIDEALGNDQLRRNFRTALSGIQAKREGIFELDLRLRPYGKAGSMAVSLEAFRRYFAPDGPAWPYERQALVKLRPIAGNPGLGQHETTSRPPDGSQHSRSHQPLQRFRQVVRRHA